MHRVAYETAVAAAGRDWTEALPHKGRFLIGK